MRRGSAATSDAAPDLAARLRGRREEIERATLARVGSLSPQPAATDPDYLEGLREAVAAAVEIAILIADHCDDAAVQPPPGLIAQARLAARSGVGIDTVVRRYVAGHSLITGFIFQEAEGTVSLEELNRILRALAESLDRLIGAVTAAFQEESETLGRRGRPGRLELVKSLLAGEPFRADELTYDLTLCHVGVVATGPGAARCIQVSGSSLDARLLTVSPADDIAWAWFGRRESMDPAEAVLALEEARLPLTTVAVGESRGGGAGWRLSHRQARAALRVAHRRHPGVVRYADVALLAGTLADDVLEASLRTLFLKPLAEPADRGRTLRQTLRRYLSANCNSSAAAAALGVNRNTVAARLREVEERLGRTLMSCLAELEVALRLEELSDIHSES